VRREPLKYSFFVLITLLAIVECFLLLSGKRILLDESYFPEREAVWGPTVHDFGEPAKFECTYFTGRKRAYEALPASQHDECPFIWTEG
jgi:hypothetical protein